MLKSFSFALPLILAIAPAHADALWLQELPIALQQAATQKKHVLLYFSGLNSKASNILKKDVFDTPAFAAYARDKFLMTEVKSFEDSKGLAKRYAVNQAPVVLMLNTEGTVVGGFMGGHDSLTTVKGMLDFALEDAVAINQKLNAAKALQGDAKARVLFEAYDALPKWIQKSNTGLMEQIKAADSSDTFGFKKDENHKAMLASEMKRISKLIDAASDDPYALLSLVNKELEIIKIAENRYAESSNDPNAVLLLKRKNAVQQELRPNLLSIKGNVMLYTANSLDDIAAAKACLLEFAKSHPAPQQSKQMHAEMLDFFADPEKLLKGVQSVRELNDAKPE